MKRITIFMGVLCLMLSSVAFAGAYHAPVQEPSLLFLTVGFGYSWSEDANVKANPSFWDPAKQGYNSDLDSSEVYSAGLGMRVSPLLALAVDVSRRPSFKYEKFQSPAGPQPVGFIGEKTRFFDLTNTSVMFNVMLFGRGIYHQLLLSLGHHITVEPVIGGGIGVAYNTVENFHSVTATQTGGFNNVNSIGDDRTITSFAWQLMAGLHVAIGQRASVDLGYRYFDGGDFEGPNYVHSVSGVTSSGLSVPPWKGNLCSNEAFINFNYLV